jgi:hypothetical protein
MFLFIAQQLRQNSSHQVILVIAHTTTASTKASIITGILKLTCFIQVFICRIPRISTREVASVKCTI